MPKKNKLIRLSLCIPNYNRAYDLLRVIEDIKAQTVKPYEVIIVDDISDKKNTAIIKKRLKLEPHMKYSVNKKNQGLAGNANIAISKSRGDYSVIISNDDRLSPHFVEEVMRALKKYPNYNVYTTNAIGITDKHGIVGDYRFYRKDAVIKKGVGARHMWKYFFISMITVSGATIYKTSYKKTHPFYKPYNNEADLDNALTFLSTQDVMFIDKPIYYVRMHQDQESTKIRLDKKKLLDNVTRCLHIYAKHKALQKTIPNYMAHMKAVYLLQLGGKYRLSIKEINQILKIKSIKEWFIVLRYCVQYVFVQIVLNVTFAFDRSSYLRYFTMKDLPHKN